MLGALGVVGIGGGGGLLYSQWEEVKGGVGKEAAEVAHDVLADAQLRAQLEVLP